jgi:hypothetical protein
MPLTGIFAGYALLGFGMYWPIRQKSEINMKPFNTSTARATALGCLATLMFAAPVTAEESSGSFGTDIDANPNQQGIVERTATTAVPTSVVETGAGINGNDSLTDTAGGIATAVNKGAEQAKQEAQAEINQLKAKVSDLEDQFAEAGPAEDEITERAFNGWMSSRSYGCIRQEKGGRCSERAYKTTYYACKQTDVYMNGTFIRADIAKTSGGRRYNAWNGRPQCSGQQNTTL